MLNGKEIGVDAGRRNIVQLKQTRKNSFSLRRKINYDVRLNSI